MKRSFMIGIFATMAAASFMPPLAAAADKGASTEGAAEEDATTEDEGTNSPGSEETVGAGTPSSELPAARSDNDPRPPVSAPQVPSGGIIKQAGIGGMTAYGRVGVLELGGSVSFESATDFTQFSLRPSIGWFFMDNVELSAILSLSHYSRGGGDITTFKALLEPSLHLPITQTVFGLIGAGIGVGFIEGPGAGLALAPRIGVNVMVGRSGILTPEFSLQYSTHDAMVTRDGALLGVSVTYGAGLGYTVMW